MEKILVVQDKEEASGSHDDRGRSSTSDALLRVEPLLFDEPGQHPDGGVYFGEVLHPIPQKLAKKIMKGDFVEMEELLPELWPVAHHEGEGKIRRNRKITDIFTWIQCFSLYTSVHGRQKPELIAELMAYMV